MLRDIWDWLKDAIGTVYSKDGLVGIAAIVLLAMVVYLLLWWTGVNVTEWLG